MSDTAFVGSVPALYEQYLVPMLFAPYARDLAARIAALAPDAVLEMAAGTGVLTRALVAALPPGTAVTATDLNQAMLDEAQRHLPGSAVRWQQADALALPFPPASFDAVACQFGAMFFPHKPTAYAEARRVLRDGGRFFFSVWDRIEANEFVQVIQQALNTVFAPHPPTFMARVPHGYFDGDLIAEHLRAAGFAAAPRMDRLAFQAHAPSARAAAIGYCEGTPMRAELEAAGPDALARATDASEAALRQRFGAGPITGQISAWIVEVAR
jgi:SAM-dependent methyltransferase